MGKLLVALVIIAGICGDTFAGQLKVIYEKQDKIIREYPNCQIDDMEEMIKESLGSTEAEIQDNAVIMLSEIIISRVNSGGEEFNKADTLLLRVSRDKGAIDSIIDIIYERLPGWYEPGIACGQDEYYEMYYPLIYILGMSGDKNSLGALVRCFQYLNNNDILIQTGCFRDDFIKMVLKKYGVISNKLCCMYPGNDVVAELLEADMRFKMLNLFEGMIPSTDTDGGAWIQNRKEIKKFIVDCLSYGGSKKGYLVRMKALGAAQKMIKSGERDMSRLVEGIAGKDPFYVHKRMGYAGKNRRPKYSYSDIVYPVRMKARDVLRELRANKG